jgi:hypothetical protein
MCAHKVITKDLTTKERSFLSFNFEEDPDLWLILLAEHFATHGKSIDDLKIGISMKWINGKTLYKEESEKDLAI